VRVVYTGRGMANLEILDGGAVEAKYAIEPRQYATGAILAFNGTTEWALDAVAQTDALWLPREDQLRELLRGAFRRLERLADTHRVEIEFAGETHAFEHPQPEDAYALAVLHVPDDVDVRSVDVAAELQILAFHGHGRRRAVDGEGA